MVMEVFAERSVPLPVYGNVEIGPLQLESGETLPDVTLRFEQVGDPEAPVILICHALTGHHRTVGTADEGWWTGCVGPGKPIDIDHFQVITFNVLGGCNGSTGPTSINPSTGRPYQGNFPFITIRDICKAQVMALDQMGIHRLAAVIGGSLGGMQALETALLYPDLPKKVIALAATPVFSDYAIAFNAIARKAIVDDPAWQKGYYPPESPPTAGLATARMIGMVTYRSARLFNQRFAHEEKSGWGKHHRETAYQVESYLDYQGRKLTDRFDANSYLYLLKAMDSHDIGRGRGGWRKAIQTLKPVLHAIGFSGDLLYPPSEIKEMVDIHRMVNTGSSFIERPTIFGHDGFLVEFEKWGGYIKEWLHGH